MLHKNATHSKFIYNTVPHTGTALTDTQLYTYSLKKKNENGKSNIDTRRWAEKPRLLKNNKNTYKNTW